MFKVLKLWKLFLIFGLFFILKFMDVKKDLICFRVWFIGCNLFVFEFLFGKVIFICLLVSCFNNVFLVRVFWWVFIVVCICFFIWLIFVFVVFF